ncbi:MAG TPA: hypothetical protein VGH07_02775 [Chthoniobacterales bacterium]
MLVLLLVLEKQDPAVTLSEQNNCGKICFRCGAKAQQVEHEHDDEHEHESPNLTSEIGISRVDD